MKPTKAEINAYEKEERKFLDEFEESLASGTALFHYPNAKAKAMFSGVVVKMVKDARASVAARAAASAKRIGKPKPAGRGLTTMKAGSRKTAASRKPAH